MLVLMLVVMYLVLMHMKKKHSGTNHDIEFELVGTAVFDYIQLERKITYDFSIIGK